MRKSFYVILIITIFLCFPGYPGAGSLNPPSEDPNSDAAGNAMHNLYDVYKLVKTRVETPLRGTGFPNPTETEFKDNKPADTNCTVDELYEAIRTTASVGKPTGKRDYGIYDGAKHDDFGGVEYPIPRFQINVYGDCNDTKDPTVCTEKDDTVLDLLTGLEWARWARWGENEGYVKFDAARTQAALCRAGGYSDWRLPSAPELQTLIDYAYYGPALSNTQGTGQWTEGNPFILIRIDKPNQAANSGWAKYWTTTYYNIDNRKVIGIQMSDGVMDTSRIFTEQGAVLLVRGNIEPQKKQKYE